MNEQLQFESRIGALEQQCRRLRAGILLGVALFFAFEIWAAQPAAQTPQTLRVRGLIVEDESGQARIVLGAPIAESGNRVGLRINDAKGIERLGMSLQANGAMVLGFDAPPGAGDDRNRERITIVADANGGAHVRFLDRRTSVAARMYLDDQNRVWTEFSDFTQQPPVRRRIGLAGDELLRTP